MRRPLHIGRRAELRVFLRREESRGRLRDDGGPVLRGLVREIARLKRAAPRLAARGCVFAAADCDEKRVALEAELRDMRDRLANAESLVAEAADLLEELCPHEATGGGPVERLLGRVETFLPSAVASERSEDAS